MENTVLESKSATTIQRIFDLQLRNAPVVAKATARERIAKLDRLLDTVLRNRQAMRDAMFADYRKPPFEVDAVEVLPITGAIRHTKSHLRRWMEPKRVPTPIAFMGSTSWVQYEPKGVCLIISPWNFPFNLSFLPLVSAIAAGNTAIIKPSEMTPHSSAVIKKIVAEVFEENEVAVVEGDVEASKALLVLPFNHIFFTGAPSIGKQVMKAAAEHLASVTLELGGKSPTIVDETADLATTATRIIRGKFANCGQICISPDYLLVQEKVYAELLDLMKQRLVESYGEDASKSDSYPRSVNARHFHRVKNYLDDAIAKGAKILAGGRTDAATNYIEPTLMGDVPDGSLLMQEEVFGPLLPVLPYRSLDEAIAFVNAGERPLTLSIFSKNKQTQRRVLAETRAGNSCVNHCQLHFYNHDLPFGGVNNSGIGKSHGWYGFEAFSNARAVYRQDFWGVSELLRAPYDGMKQRILDMAIRWL
ncbi:MAG: aldehyde dehydrogenase family protein [Saprospiraceae bacterium]|nr:aldehyde dehydrogenase family protein [Saprospiraceae bacterium]